MTRLIFYYQLMPFIQQKLFRKYKSSASGTQNEVWRRRHSVPVHNTRKKSKAFEWLSMLLSIAAISISGLTLYFQFFYERYNLTARFVRGDFINDSTFVVGIIYNNKGNQYSTILTNNVDFYNADTSKPIKVIDSTSGTSVHKPLFIKIVPAYNASSKQERQIKYNPEVLSPGQQVYREFINPVHFDSLALIGSSLNLYDTIRISVTIGFINREGYSAYQTLDVGWLTLDPEFRVQSYQLSYEAKELGEGGYISAIGVGPSKLHFIF